PFRDPSPRDASRPAATSPVRGPRRVAGRHPSAAGHGRTRRPHAPRAWRAAARHRRCPRTPPSPGALSTATYTVTQRFKYAGPRVPGCPELGRAYLSAREADPVGDVTHGYRIGGMRSGDVDGAYVVGVGVD